MSLFDYTKKMNGVAPETLKLTEKAKEEKAVEQPSPEPVTEMAGPAVLRQVPADSVKIASGAFPLKLELPDAQSSSGSGVLYLKSEAVKPHYNSAGQIQPMFCDITLQNDFAYVIRDAKNELSVIEISNSDVAQLWTQAQRTVQRQAASRADELDLSVTKNHSKEGGFGHE